MSATRLGPAPLVAPDAEVEDSDARRLCRGRAAHPHQPRHASATTATSWRTGRSCSPRSASSARSPPMSASTRPTTRPGAPSQHHFTYRSDDYFAGEAARRCRVFAWRQRERRHRRPRRLDRPRRHDHCRGHGRHRRGDRRRRGGDQAGRALHDRRRRPGEADQASASREDVAERLLALAWWDWPHEQAARGACRLPRLSVEAFLEKYA